MAHLQISYTRKKMSSPICGDSEGPSQPVHLCKLIWAFCCLFTECLDWDILGQKSNYTNFRVAQLPQESPHILNGACIFSGRCPAFAMNPILNISTNRKGIHIVLFVFFHVQSVHMYMWYTYEYKNYPYWKSYVYKLEIAPYNSWFLNGNMARLS